jgi:hypothetical protein
MNDSRRIKTELRILALRATPEYYDRIAKRIPGTRQDRPEAGASTHRERPVWMNAYGILAAVFTVVLISSFMIRTGTVQDLLGKWSELLHPSSTTGQVADRIVFHDFNGMALSSAYSGSLKMLPGLMVGENLQVSEGKPSSDVLNGKWKDAFGVGTLPVLFPDYITWGRYVGTMYVELWSTESDPELEGRHIYKGFEIYINGFMRTKEGEQAYNEFLDLGLERSMLDNVPVTLGIATNKEAPPDYYASFAHNGKEYLVIGVFGISKAEFIDFVKSFF